MAERPLAVPGAVASPAVALSPPQVVQELPPSPGAGVTVDDGTDEDVAEDERSEPDPGDDEDRDHEGGKARRGFEVRVHHLCPQRSFVLSALNQRARASCFRMLLRAPAGSPAQQQSSTGAGSLIQPREQQHRAKSQESAAAQAASLQLTCHWSSVSSWNSAAKAWSSDENFSGKRTSPPSPCE